MEKFKQFYIAHPNTSIVLLLLTIWPVGLYLLWKRPSINIWVKLVVSLIVVIYGVIMLTHLGQLNQLLKGL